jgi:hypothetical protein
VVDSKITKDDTNLAQASASKSRSGGGDDWGMGAFFLGLILIPFSLVWIWKNEKKIVRFHQVIVEAELDVVTDVDIEKIDDALEFRLTHLQGKAHNKAAIQDEDIDYSAADCYRVTRTVEMYQTKETRHEEKDSNDNVTVRYTYADDWYSEPIDSGNFHDHSKKNCNPTNSWPLKSKTTEAKAINLGAYYLSSC